MKKAFLLISIAIISIATYSQSNNSQLLNKLVEKEILTQEEADALEEDSQEKSSSSLEKGVQNVKNILNTPYLQLGGYALLHHSYSNARDIKHNSAIRFAFLSLRGEPIKKLNYFVLFSMRHAELTEYNATWAMSDAIQVKVGQQKTAIAIENQMSLVVLEFIQNAKVLDYLVGGGYDVLSAQNGKHNSGRDIGIKVFGNVLKVNNRPVIDYAVAIYQGAGINTVAKRNNKDFAANVLLSPYKGFRIGGGTYFGQAVYGIEGVLENREHVRNRWIISSDYKSERLTARAEYVRGNDAGISKEGIYGIATWALVPNKWQLLSKVEYYNDNKDINREFIDYAAGVNFHFAKMCRIQANYTYTDYSKKWGNKNSHMAEAQLQVVF